MIETSVFVTISIFIIGNIVATVWWASKITSMVDNLQKVVEKLAIVIDDHTKNLYPKSEALHDMKKVDEQLTLMWKRIDEISDMTLEIKTRCSIIFGQKHFEAK